MKLKQKISWVFFGIYKKSSTFAKPKRTRGGAAVARRAHNPKVIGSIPIPATKVNYNCFEKDGFMLSFFFLYTFSK